MVITPETGEGVQTLVWQNQAKAGRLRPKYLSDKLSLQLQGLYIKRDF